MVRLRSTRIGYKEIGILAIGMNPGDAKCRQENKKALDNVFWHSAVPLIETWPQQPCVLHCCRQLQQCKFYPHLVFLHCYIHTYRCQTNVRKTDQHIMSRSCELTPVPNSNLQARQGNEFLEQMYNTHIQIQLQSSDKEVDTRDRASLLCIALSHCHECIW
jgi:hypothetical protein